MKSFLAEKSNLSFAILKDLGKTLCSLIMSFKSTTMCGSREFSNLYIKENEIKVNH